MQHLVKQNTGILLLYHNHKAGEAVVGRDLELNSQYASNIFFALYFFNRVILPGIGDYVRQTVMVLSMIVLVFALYYAVEYIRQLYGQVKKGAPLNVPALCFWFLSLMWLMPVAFLGKSYFDGILIPNVMHWIQYIGLNYLLVKNKYSDPVRLGWLPLKHPMLVFLAVCLGVVAIYEAAGLGTLITALSLPMLRALQGVILGLSNVHYFQDAYIWRFREEFNRNAMLPYLKAGVRPASATAGS
jgi:hypothetical protein